MHAYQAAMFSLRNEIADEVQLAVRAAVPKELSRLLLHELEGLQSVHVCQTFSQKAGLFRVGRQTWELRTVRNGA